MGTASGGETISVTINENKMVFIFSDSFYFAKRKDSEKHRHSFYEVHFIVQGMGVMRVGDKLIEFEPGCLLIIKPDTDHIHQDAGNLDIAKYIFKFSVTDVSNRHDDIAVPLLDAASSQEVMIFSECFEIKGILEKVRCELRQQEKGFALQIASCLSAMIVLLARKRGSTSPPCEKAANKHDNVPVQTATIIDYFFDQNYNKSVKIEELCELVHLSQSQLNRTIKSVYGVSFKEKHTQTRINYIAHLLLNEVISITQIAHKCGFDDVSSFSNFFKHNMQMSPLQYRKQNRIL